MKLNFKRADFPGLSEALSDDPPENYFDEENAIENDWSAWKLFFFTKVNKYIPKLKPQKFNHPTLDRRRG